MSSTHYKILVPELLLNEPTLSGTSTAILGVGAP